MALTNKQQVKLNHYVVSYCKRVNNYLMFEPTSVVDRREIANHVKQVVHKYYKP